MRQIKFRGKRIDNGEWVYGDLVSHYENQRRYIACDELAYTYTECGINRLVTERAHEVYPETVGQYTGLLDKNGKEIYEGDIVKSQRGYMFVVEWVDDGRFLGFTAKRSIAYVGQEPAVEVIGNINENPELLEVSHE